MFSRCIRFGRLALTVLGLTALAACESTKPVVFDSLGPYPGASSVALGQVTGYLTLPETDRPPPVAILLHGCSGLLPMNEHWAQLLSQWGIASLRVDSFTRRGIDQICTRTQKPVPRVSDVNGAIAYLRSRDDVDASRIVVVGWSHGANVAMRVAREHRALREKFKPDVLAAVAFYPYCGSRSRLPFRIPLLLLIGEADDWTPSDLCEKLVANLPENTASVDLVVYENATHSYDGIGYNLWYLGHRLVYNGPAHRDSIRRLRVFMSNAFNIP